ncbi:hypothetical protein CC78DRAFT_186851 [Lojkania enalia]|uniref:Uncharacterized protein n=1 Tax=Lojkania enalia TaxID=147567 RepID=A0A9P4N4D2_9PLEO|nr:hypothetical protein CC78DRAFT_186851 [Didymosphaeria enalia]
MLEPRPDAYAVLESSFHDAPQLKTHKTFPRRSDEFHYGPPKPEPLKQDTLYLNDDIRSEASSKRHTPLASPGALNSTDTGLPPTPPSISHDKQPSTTFSPPPYADGVVSSLMSKKSSLGTPINQRSPPTPDPSPPRTTESVSVSDRPIPFTYPSSRAESFKTAREDLSDSRVSTPLAGRPRSTKEDRGLGFVFEREESDATPTNMRQYPLAPEVKSGDAGGSTDPLHVENVSDREWNRNLMRNVTIRKKRNPRALQKDPTNNLDSVDTTPKRSVSLRERIQASGNSPPSPSSENLAQSIGWPEDTHDMPDASHRDAESKRLSASSMSSTVVEVLVISSPPETQRTLRHSGKNLAYRRDEGFSSRSSTSYSNRNSVNSQDALEHHLSHKRASLPDGKKRISTDSDALAYGRTESPLSIRKQAQTNAAYTLAHQDSVKRILQPAAESLSRSISLSRPYAPDRSFHKRISSAPEAATREVSSRRPKTFLEISPPGSPREVLSTSLKSPKIERTSPSTLGYKSNEASPTSPKLPVRSLTKGSLRSPANLNKSLPDLPVEMADTPQKENAPAQKTLKAGDGMPTEHDEMATSKLEDKEMSQQHNVEPWESARKQPSLLSDTVTPVRRGSLSTRGRSEERRRSTTSQDRTSTSRETLEMPRRSHEWHSLHPDDHRRISFDRSTSRTEEHAMARHLFAQTTPFSQFSDTPIEVSEATAVSIYPHNNHSLLVVQQVARSNALSYGEGHGNSEAHTPSLAHPAPEIPSSPPLPETRSDETEPQSVQQPTLTIEPSTPPMKITLPVPGVVDSPLKNPRQAPEPPVVKLIPPTPAEELERQLPPGPPKRSNSHPQRRLSLVQRARRYSDNLISPFLARASSTRGRHVSDPHVRHEKLRIPSVNDEDGSLHPFWRPRGFWDGFEDSDTESEDDVLPEGGDTSDVADPEPGPAQRKLGTLSRRLTNSFKGTGGFLIGNSIGLERAGTNKRRHYVEVPAKKSVGSPMILIQPPTLPSRPRSPRIEKRGSRASMRSSGSCERPRRESRRAAWRKGKTIPGLGMQVQYIGLSGVKERIRERKAEKRREEIRQSIGSRIYVEGGVNNSGAA